MACVWATPVAVPRPESTCHDGFYIVINFVVLRVFRQVLQILLLNEVVFQIFLAVWSA